MRIAVCLIAGIVLSSAAIAGRTGSARAIPKPYGVEAQPKFEHMSSASCSASACHGGGRVGKLGSEHSTWAPEAFPAGEHDPHSKAYRSLFNSDSVRMAKFLGGGPAHENPLCLQCHAPAGVEDRTARAEGVGCSACHGSGEKWIAEHYLPSWKAKSNREKWSETGFVPTKNIVARVANCASCHVGSEHREVNHDLIAAGHPRLAFEYTRFHFQSGYRKHWEERVPQPEFEARAWVIGQAASLRAAVEVLHARAERAKENKSPWPEFAGYSCFACHQTIGKGETKAEAAGRTLGQPGWEVWYIAALGPTTSAGRELFPSADRRPLTETLKLKALMGRLSARASEVEMQSAKSLAELDVWLAALQMAEDESNPRVNPYLILEALVGSAVNKEDWDSLASHYLGCAAMVHAAGGKPDMKDTLHGLRRDLHFPKIGGERFNSPARFDREASTRVRAAFGRLRDSIPPGDR